MLAHLTERVILKEKTNDNDPSKETVTLVNATNLEPLLSKVDVKVTEELK